MSSMRPIRSIATALLVASVAVAGCAKSQPNQTATGTSTPPAASAPPATKAPAADNPTPATPVKTNAAAPRILSVTTSPALPNENGWLKLSGAGTVTFHVQATNTQRVRFSLGPTGTGVGDLAKLLGEDTNRRNGWTLAWHYRDEPLLAHLYVRAIGSSGAASAETVLSLYHPESVVLADGRHPVYLKTVDAGHRTITFDLIQLYWGDEAAREAARDHQESPPPNDYYLRNVNPRLRTLPVRADATITVNTLAAAWTGSATRNVPVTLSQLASLLGKYSPPFWITVRHDRVAKIAEQYLP
jgi:hypothetical protein